VAQKEKRPDITGFSFVSGPKGDHPNVPGLNAILGLTDEQKLRLVQARDETIGSAALRDAGRKVKENPNATDADREAVGKLRAEAEGQYDHRVAEILTPAQKELILRLQVLYGQAREAVGKEYEGKLVASKGNKEETMRLREEARTALTADFTRRVNEILTAEQRAAFQQAGADEKRRADESPKGKK
jgi:Spy/CpxP family protein refolding chaperone